MILPTLEIAAKSTQEKADLIVERAKGMQESRYEAVIALSLLGRSNGYLELACKIIGEFAEKKAKLEYRDWTRMLSVGRRALEFPELDVAFRDGRLNWSKIRALLPVLTRENVTEWIVKATLLTSNQVELEEIQGPACHRQHLGPVAVLELRPLLRELPDDLAGELQVAVRATEQREGDRGLVARLLHPLRPLLDQIRLLLRALRLDRRRRTNHGALLWCNRAYVYSAHVATILQEYQLGAWL